MASTSVSVPSSTPAPPEHREREWSPWPFVAAGGGLCGVLFIAAAVLHRVVSAPTLAVVGAKLLDISSHNVGECIAVALCLAVGLFCRPFELKWLRQLEAS